MSGKKNSELVLSDNVLNRIVQIVQEGMLMGVDVSDLMRQIRVEVRDPNANVLELTESYRSQVKAGHERMIAEAERLEVERRPIPGPVILGLVDELPQSDKKSN